MERGKELKIQVFASSRRVRAPHRIPAPLPNHSARMECFRAEWIESASPWEKEVGDRAAEQEASRRSRGREGAEREAERVHAEKTAHALQNDLVMAGRQLGVQ